MKHDRILAAYDKAAPDARTRAAIYTRVLAKADEESSQARRPVLRRVLIAAAITALTVALGTAGYAAYQKWRLPEPEPLPTGVGFYELHESSEYLAPDTEKVSETAAPLSDESFMLRAREILTQAGVENVNPQTMTVVRQKNLYWDREEVEVRFDREGVQTSVRFDAESGVFLGMHGIDWQLEGAAACQTQAEADALALRYYESLPVEQGYVLLGCEKYDAQYWSYDFCREVEPGLYNEYEMVRVAINPVSGELTGCVVFYVPLLDDHEPGDEPITEAQAEQIARENAGLDLSEYKLVRCEKAVGHPNWNYTGHALDTPAKAAGVTRLCWSLVFDGPETLFADELRLLVDYYTGEILGGYATK